MRKRYATVQICSSYLADQIAIRQVLDELHKAAGTPQAHNVVRLQRARHGLGGMRLVVHS